VHQPARWQNLDSKYYCKWAEWP